MGNLRTFKEICNDSGNRYKRGRFNYDSTNDAGNYALEDWKEFKKEAKQEAIAWIKELETEKLKELDRLQKTEIRIEYEDLKDKITYGFDGTINWIKHFFGIKSEELK